MTLHLKKISIEGFALNEETGCLQWREWEEWEISEDGLGPVTSFSLDQHGLAKKVFHFLQTLPLEEVALMSYKFKTKDLVI